VALGIVSGEVEKVDAGEDDEESAEEGDRVDGVGRVEATEEDEGGCERGGGEGYVVEWVDAVMSVSQLRSPGILVDAYIFVEN